MKAVKATPRSVEANGELAAAGKDFRAPASVTSGLCNSRRVTNNHDPPGRGNVCHRSGYKKAELIAFPFPHQPLPILPDLLNDQEAGDAFHYDEQRARECQQFPPPRRSDEEIRVHRLREDVEASDEKEGVNGYLENRECV